MKRRIPFPLFTLALGILPVNAQLDTNGNDMSDIWERHFNNGQLFPSGFLPGGDEDGDGQSNFMESVAGTDPLTFDPPQGHLVQGIRHVPATWLSDPEEEEPVLLTPEAFEIDWHSLAGKSYVLLCSPDLTGNSWIPVGSPIYGYNGSVTIGNLPSHTDGTLPDRMFWRIEVSDLDSDGDSLSDYEEYLLGLDPFMSTSHFGIPDLWLATHYSDLLLSGQFHTFDPNGDSDGDGISNIEEQLGGTDPNTADSPDAQLWLALQGTGEEDVRVSKTRQFTIPAGQTALVIVAITSDEYPYYTDPETEDDYNDIVEWKIEPTVGSNIEGQIDVNARDADWEIAEMLGETLPGLPGPVHYEVVKTFTAPPTAPLTVDVEIAATNIGDGALPSHIAVGVLPLDLDIQYGSQGGTIELAEEKEDVDDGGYISIKSETRQGEDITPTTFLIIKPAQGLPANAKVRLKFDTGDHYTVAREGLGSNEVVSEDTEFPANEETRLYLVGKEISNSRGAEEVSMQVKIKDDWLDGDSLKATVVQTQFHVDLRIFIPYNWVNIPYHPAHWDEIAKGDHRTYDPALNGTYRVAQLAILNIYPEWVPDAGNRLIDDGKWAGLTEHYKTSDVTNFNLLAKHSEDTTVTPSYINSGASPSDSGTADLSQVNASIVTTLTNDDECFVKFEGSAKEPIIIGAAAIDWIFSVGVVKIDPLNPEFRMEGEHDGFPSYEIYINSKHLSLPHTTCLQWGPPLSAGVLELSTNLDVAVGPVNGIINK